MLTAALCAPALSAQMVTWEQISSLPAPPADHRITYGTHEHAFGELRLPSSAGPHPVAVVIHGGCWRAENDFRHATHLSAALTRAGVATWTIEYRRIGNPGGGWPGTFQDVAAAAEHVKLLAQKFPLDLNRVVFVGHSAGGHLALWLAARHNVPRKSAIRFEPILKPRGVIALAPITDLRTYAAGTAYCNASVTPLVGGSADQVAERYAQASPSELLPLGVPARLVHGALDRIVLPEQSHLFAKRATAKGDNAEVVLVDGAGHFDLIAPFAPAWATVERTVLSLTGGVER